MNTEKYKNLENIVKTLQKIVRKKLETIRGEGTSEVNEDIIW